MKTRLIFSILLLVSGQTIAKSIGSPTGCLGITPSAAYHRCWVDTATEQKNIYEKSFMNYLDKIKSAINENYNIEDVIEHARRAKTQWDNFIIDDCTVEASIWIKESPAYYDGYYLCLTQHYSKRIAYFENFDSGYR